jgi:hypothetical protein
MPGLVQKVGGDTLTGERPERHVCICSRSTNAAGLTMHCQDNSCPSRSREVKYQNSFNPYFFPRQATRHLAAKTDPWKRASILTELRSTEISRSMAEVSSSTKDLPGRRCLTCSKGKENDRRLTRHLSAGDALRHLCPASTCASHPGV